MDGRAGAILKKAFETLLDLPQMFKGILVRSTIPDEENILLGTPECRFCRQTPYDLLERPRKRRRLAVEDLDGSGWNGSTERSVYSAIRPETNPRETDQDGQFSLHIEQSRSPVNPFVNGTFDASHDDVKDQMAMLLTNDMAVQVANIGRVSRLVEQQRRLLQDIEREILIAKVGISSLQATFKNPEDPEEGQEIQEEIASYERKLRNHTDRYDNVSTELVWLRQDESRSRHSFQGQLETMLAQSGQLDLSTLEPAIQVAPIQEGLEDEMPMAEELGEAVASSSNPEEVLRYAAQEEMDNALAEYQNADEAFDAFDDFQWSERQDFKALKKAGNIDIDQEEFDHLMIGEQRQRTRDLQDATDRYKKALEQAKATGLYTGQWDDMGPENRDKYDGFYDEEVEAAILKQTDPEVVDKWQSMVCAEFEGLEDMAVRETPDDVTDWEAESVGMSSGFSVVDHGNVGVAEYGMYHDRISCWKEHCDILRQERLAEM